MCMHKNYDFVIAPSDATALIYKEAFNTESSHIKICPMPRVDFITDGNAPSEKFYNLNPFLADKKSFFIFPLSESVTHIAPKC